MEEKGEDKPDVPVEEPAEEKPMEEEKEPTGQPWHAIAGDVISMAVADLIPVADTSLRDLFPPPPSPPPILPRPSKQPEQPEQPPHPETPDKPKTSEQPQTPKQPPRPDRTAEEEAKRTQLRAQALAVPNHIATHP